MVFSPKTNKELRTSPSLLGNPRWLEANLPPLSLLSFRDPKPCACVVMVEIGDDSG